MGEETTEILVVNEDHQAVATRLEEALQTAASVNIVKTIQGGAVDKAKALDAVARGDYQVCLVIPAGTTRSMRATAQWSARQALSVGDGSAGPAPSPATIELHFDPTVLGAFRSAVKSQVQLLTMQIEMEKRMQALAELLPEKIKALMTAAAGPMAAQAMMGLAPVELKWDRQPALTIKDELARGRHNTPIPDAVQQNVPAWSLFGIFFIVLPMAGSFINERLCGAQYRMLSMPVSYLTISAGKVCAFMLVCLVQFALILGIGRWVLPLLGAPQFQIGPAPAAMALVALSAVLAATGYGILLGTMVNSYEQASMFGPISVVIAAALGGIMVPVYAMPAFMQKLSVLSPLGWAQNAFLNLLIRGGDPTAVQTDVYLLLAFALACVGAAWYIHTRKTAYGRISAG